MEPMEITGKTVEEAVQKALDALGIKHDNAVIEVLNEPAQGIFGIIGSKEARVSVEKRFEPQEYLLHYIKGIIEGMNIDARVQVEEDDERLSVSINGKKTGILIGRRGKTLNEMQYLANTVMRRQFIGLRKMIIVDVEDYRSRRERTLEQLARGVARRVKMDGCEHVLEPMSPQERRIIHLALQEHEDVITYSKGEDPYRKVVIAPR